MAQKLQFRTLIFSGISPGRFIFIRMSLQSHLYGFVLRMDIIVYIILEEYIAYYEVGKIDRQLWGIL